VHPDATLGALELELRSRGGSIFSNSAPGAERTLENDSLRWVLEPSTAVIELEVLLENDTQELAWRFRRAGDDELVERIWIGGHPLERSTAVPLYHAVPGVPDGPIEFELTHETERPRVVLAFTPEGPTHFELSVSYREPHAADELTLLQALGWSPAADKHRIHGSSSTGSPLSTVIHVGFARKEVLIAPRIDGRWPARDRVLVNGDLELPLDEIEVVFPSPPDARLESLLGTRPAVDSAPGSIQIWSTTVTGGQLDASLFDADTARGLRALGYLNAEDSGRR